jgi:hypothetical protein
MQGSARRRSWKEPSISDADEYSLADAVLARLRQEYEDDPASLALLQDRHKRKSVHEIIARRLGEALSTASSRSPIPDAKRSPFEQATAMDMDDFLEGVMDEIRAVAGLP